MTAPRPDLAVVEETAKELREELRRDIEIDKAAADGGDTYCGKRAAKSQEWLNAIDQLLAERAAHEWRPIETAPKNQKVLVFYRNSLGNGRTVTACYHTQLPWSDNADPSPSDGEYAPEGWYEASETHEEIHFTDHPPTHWMPLPAAPQPPKGPADE